MGTDPATNSMTLMSVAKVVESGTKTRKKSAKMIGWLHILSSWYTILACLEQDPNLTWDRGNFLHDKMGNYQDKP